MGQNEETTAFLTNFCFYDGRDHLVPLEGGVIESGKDVYFDGVLNAAHCPEPEKADGGILVKKGGPVRQWWITGMQKGHNVVIGISTDMGDIYLKLPMDEYFKLMKDLWEKANLTKLIIEIMDSSLDMANDLEFEELIDKIQSYGSEDYFSNEDVVRHGKFIVEQVKN